MASQTVSAGSRTGPNSILLKTVMAVTGLIFIGFIVAHMYGNLMILGGQEAFDEYAHHLRTFGEPMLPYGGFLWVMRITLLVSLLLHAWSAFVLWSRASRARPTRYAVKQANRGLFWARAMRWGGVALLLFVVFHLLHFTTNTIQLAGDFARPSDRLVSSFELWWAVLIYFAAVAALGLHLRHGVWSACMTLGLNTSLRAAERIQVVAIAVAAVVVVGFMLPPVLILFGVVP